MICDEAHTALGEKTSAAIRSFPEPIYIGMTATEQLIAKQVSDVFPASVDDLPLADAARRGLIAPLRCLRVPPAAAINSVPIVGGDFEERALADALDHQALNQAAASLYRERFDSTPGIVYAAGVDHAYNLAQEFRAAGLKAEAVSGRTPPVQLAETLAAYERGEINVLINAMLLAEGWNSPRATVVHAPRADRVEARLPAADRPDHADAPAQGGGDRRRLRRRRPRRTPSASSRSTRLLDADFYREGARVTPAPRRRVQRRARRQLSPAPWLVPVTPDVAPPPRRDPARVAADRPQVPGRRRAALLGDDRRPPAPLRPARRVRQKFAESGREGRARAVPLGLRRREPEPAPADDRAADRVSMRVERADFDDLVTLVSQRRPGRRTARRESGSSCARSARARRTRPIRSSPRWTWRLARATRKIQDRRASAEFPEAKRLLGAVANSRGHRHEENVGRLVQVAKALPIAVGAALLASAEGYTPRATSALDRAREELGETIRRSRTRSRTTCPRRRLRPASSAAGGSGRRAARVRPSNRMSSAQPAERAANGSAAAPGDSPPTSRRARGGRRRRKPTRRQTRPGRNP